jgi:hypothetical protein
MSQAAQPGPYLGAGVGESDDEILNESASAYKLFAGVNLAPYIGLEFSYVDLGEFANRQLWQDGIAYEVVGYLPMAPNLDLIVRGGFFDWQVADRFSSVSGTDATFGLGVQAQLNRHLSLRGEYQSFFDVDGGDVDLLSASLSFHF